MISPAFAGLPPHGRGQRIGLFGGSFDPAHEGHRQASLLALRRLALDRVWWCVSPGNPLKDTTRLPSQAERMARAARIAADPRIAITGFERRLGSAYTSDLLTALASRCPSVRFVFLMGSDSFADLQRWKNWRGLVATMPIAVIDRPGSTHRATRAPAATALAPTRLPERDAPRLAEAAPPAWVFLHGPRSTLSSTAIRSGR